MEILRKKKTSTSQKEHGTLITNIAFQIKQHPKPKECSEKK